MLVSEIAGLAKDIETYGVLLSDLGMERGALHLEEFAENNPMQQSRRSVHTANNKIANAVTQSQHLAKINEVLGEWEEPEIDEHGHVSRLLWIVVLV